MLLKLQNFMKDGGLGEAHYFPKRMLWEMSISSLCIKALTMVSSCSHKIPQFITISHQTLQIVTFCHHSSLFLILFRIAVTI